jgi:hypothetical protein
MRRTTPSRNKRAQSTPRAPLGRDEIVGSLAVALESSEHIIAFWEGGAPSYGRLDEWSDIDLYVVVEDDWVEEVFKITERSIRLLSPIKQKYAVQHPKESGIFQAFYRLVQASEYLMIDLAVLKMSAPDKYLEPEIHGPALFHFNKENQVRIPRLDRREHAKKVRAASKRLKERFELFNCFVQKEINRGNALEAADLYHRVVYGSLVDALRIKHSPMHHDFRTRYIHYELPRKVTARLQNLYFVGDVRDLQRKYDEASEWFREVAKTI